MEFVQAVVKVATELEELNLYGDDCDGYDLQSRKRVSLDDLCADLPSYLTFWYRFRLFQIFPSSNGYRKFSTNSFRPSSPLPLIMYRK